ncbi:MAG: ABC transporter permease [Propionibacteriales bacterium]|nr:ABC transporter permease [Propionibacteriales bacterium]
MSRLAGTDLVRLAGRGARGHPVRFLLSALGIGIGVAAMVAVAGITQSSKAELSNLLEALGTNVLKVYPTADLRGRPSMLPRTAAPMLGSIGPVTAVSGLTVLQSEAAYRSPYVPSGQTSSVLVTSVSTDLLATLRGQVADGHWFTATEQRYPAVVLGWAAARRLGVDAPGLRLWMHQQWWVVVGVLRPLPLAPELDSSVLVGGSAAQDYLGADGTLSAVYLRVPEDQLGPVERVVPPTASPEHPELVGVSRPSDALAAKLVADATLNRLLLGLAAIGLLVGGIGVSNTMIIAALERRPEIGLRRALGATRGQIAAQFLAESLVMATAGGVLGVLLGDLVTVVYAQVQGWPLSLPLWVSGAAVLLTVLVGAVAGLYPAVKACRVPPTEALSST